VRHPNQFNRVLNDDVYEELIEMIRQKFQGLQQQATNRRNRVAPRHWLRIGGKGVLGRGARPFALQA
jgi:hypothetical protein